ncbi:MAG: sulfotransferase, partial [Syntrophothermus sp.]
MNTGNFRRSPWWFRLINKGWRHTYPLTRISLQRDDLIKAARNQTGLTDFGTAFDTRSLDILLNSIETEAELHPVGRFITRQRFVSLLVMRLRAEYYFKKYPAILEQDLYPSWFILGLQRTGTTKLQRLLATDPDHRVVYSWEAINPVPLSLNFDPVENAVKDIRKRISVAETSARALGIMSPGFNAIHPIQIHEPEEDILVLDISFMSTTPEAMMNVPTYAHWLEQTDQTPAYLYAIKLLKLLQWQRPARRWILKSPHHLEFAEIISKNFGDVHFLWPHRNIYESIPSFLSMVTYTNMIFSDNIDIR